MNVGGEGERWTKGQWSFVLSCRSMDDRGPYETRNMHAMVHQFAKIVN